MRFFKRLAGFLGFLKDDGANEARDQHHQDSEGQNQHQHQQARFRETGLPRKGFGVPVQVAVDRPHVGPVLVPCNSGDGGVQGLRWYANRLRVDDDGDVADEFVEEVLPETSTNEVDDQHKPLPRFEVKYGTRPARVKNQVLSHDGKIHQCIEYQGKFQMIQI